MEALVGADAYRFLAREHVLVAQLSEALKARPEELPGRVNDLVERLRTAEKEIERVRGAAAAGAPATDWPRPPPMWHGVSFVGHRVDGAGPGDVRKLALDIRGRMAPEQPAVVAVVGSADGKPAIVVATNERARQSGLSARELIAVAAPVLGGSGGGKDDVAQGGGTQIAGIDAALQEIRRAVGQRVGGRLTVEDVGMRRGVRLGIDAGAVADRRRRVRPGGSHRDAGGNGAAG